MKSIVAAIRRLVVILAAIITYGIFIPVGIVFYVVLLLRATISIALASFIAAMGVSRTLNPDIDKALHRAILFFPTGLEVIWLHFRSIWREESNPEQHSEKGMAAFLSFLTNLALAVVFVAVLSWLAPDIFRWVGLPTGIGSALLDFVQTIWGVLKILLMIAAVVLLLAGFAWVFMEIKKQEAGSRK